MDREQIIEVLESIGKLLDLKGENPFKIRAYTTAARALENYSGNLAEAAEGGTLSKIDGVGDALSAKITELVQTGSLAYFEKLRSEFPPTIFELFDLPGLGAKKVKSLYDNLGVASIADLQVACEDGRVAALAGFGEKTSAKLLKSIADRARYAGFFRLDEATLAAGPLLEDLRLHPEIIQLSAAGSYRRSKEVLHDLDFVASSKHPELVIEDFTKHPAVREILASGPTKASVRLANGMQCDLRVVSDQEYPFALVYFTGSKEHNVALRGRALKQGWTLNEYRLAPVEGKSSAPIPAIHNEEELYRALDLDPIVPELREDLGEIEAAAEGTLPDLVEWTNLRGTFHNHTTASDGRATLEEMAQAAMDLGLEYLGIADHSKASFQANGLDATRLRAQISEIEKLNVGFETFRLFSGTECDILPDGTLDFADDLLAQVDYVVASVHSSFTQPEAKMTARIIRAISNPHVTILGHLTGRLLLSRNSYAVDIPAIIEAAAANGTIIELNCDPHRMEMDWRWWPLAKEKGVRCSINPDAHRTAGLQNLWFGVAAARKGWLTRKDIINCLPLAEVETALQAKRAQRHLGVRRLDGALDRRP